MRRYYVELDGKWQWIWATKRANELWFHHQGESYCVEHTIKKSRKGGGNTGIQTGEIKSPMPGKIMKVLKFPGDNVVTGETIVVMEAMKMEYSLDADVDGIVEKVNVSEGQQVGSNELLAQIQKATDD